MPVESTSLSASPMQGSHLEPSRYKITWRCTRCGKTYTKIASSPNAKDPLCPRRKCIEARAREQSEKEAQNLRKMLEERAAPAVTGFNDGIKAIDKTADIVMEDYKMTDLNSSVRPGEIAAPKLPPKLQEMADNFFTAPSKMSKAAARRLTKMAMSGQGIGMTPDVAFNSSISPMNASQARKIVVPQSPVIDDTSMVKV
jgi:predicted  nucleic acid-binding Zn-ribbon protein